MRENFSGRGLRGWYRKYRIRAGMVSLVAVPCLALLCFGLVGLGWRRKTY